MITCARDRYERTALSLHRSTPSPLSVSSSSKIHSSARLSIQTEFPRFEEILPWSIHTETFQFLILIRYSTATLPLLYLFRSVSARSSAGNRILLSTQNYSYSVTFSRILWQSDPPPSNSSRRKRHSAPLFWSGPGNWIRTSFRLPFGKSLGLDGSWRSARE